MSDAKVLASAAVSASYNMVLQLLFRGLTFVLNGFVLHFISPDLLGVVNVRLTLLYSTILFVSREAFRRGCLSKTTDKQWQQMINLIWCILPIGVCSAGVFGYIWLHILEQPDSVAIPHYDIGVYCFAGSALIELLAEPLWISGQIYLFVRTKVVIEGFSLALKCVLTAVLVIYFPQWGIISFSAVQIVFVSLYVVLYYGYFFYHLHSGTDSKDKYPFSSLRDFLPSLSCKPLVHWELAQLTASFLTQSVLKQLLTEGERYMMTIFKILNFADQGVYDIVNNLGSLAARFIFLPLEDSGYLFFSRTLGRQGRESLNKESLSLATDVLECLLKLVSLIGVTILAFGYSYSYLLLHLYGGALLSTGSGPVLLRVYCVYVLLIAINGITECFVFATMSKKEVDRYNGKMLIFSLLFLVSSWYLTGLVGSVGFILANCLNMLARISHSIYFLISYYRGSGRHPLLGLVPSAPVALVYGIAWAVTQWSERHFLDYHGSAGYIIHIGIGAVSLLAVGLVILLTEKRFIGLVKKAYSEYRKQKSS